MSPADRTRKVSPYTLFAMALTACAFGLSAQAQQQNNFLPSNLGDPPSLPSLPSLPDPEPPSVLPDPAAAAAAGITLNRVPDNQGIVLPRNFRIAAAANGSDTPAKISYYLGSTWSIRNFLEAGFVAGIPNLTSAPSQPVPPYGNVNDPGYQHALDTYGDQMDDWRRTNEVLLRYKAARFEVGFATAETRQLLSNLALPILFHQQARYLPADVDAGFGERMLNAASSIVLTRSDSGMLVPNYSKLGGTVAAAFIGKSLYANAFNAPELNSGHFVMHYITYSLLGDLATNAAHEMVRATLNPELTMSGRFGRPTEDSYYPMSAGGKFIYWMHSTYMPRNFIQGALIAAVPTITDEPKEPINGFPSTYYGYPNFQTADDAWGTIVLGWKQNLENDVRYHEHRFIGGFSESETQMFLQNFAIPVALNMDPRYIALGSEHPAGARLAHAFTSLAVGHTDSGARTVNLPVLGGTVGAAFIAKGLYYPQLGTPSLESSSILARTISFNFAADAIYNVLSEFFGHRAY